MALAAMAEAARAPRPVAGGRGSARSAAWRGPASGAAGLVAALAGWWMAAQAVHAPETVLPTPGGVLLQLFRDGWSFYAPNLAATVDEAVRGFFWGNAAAVGLAAVALLLPALHRLILQVAVISYCIPIVALGPLLTIVFSDRTPMVALAAISVFFTTLVGALLGLRAADPLSLDLVRAYGGGRWAQLVKVRMVVALPALFGALGIAAPTAFLGAILGEWLGSVDTGLGVAMVISMQQLMAARTFGIALVCAAVAGLSFALITWAGRLLTPWAAEQAARAPA